MGLTTFRGTHPTKGYPLLEGGGSISAVEAKEKALEEYLPHEGLEDIYLILFIICRMHLFGHGRYNNLLISPSFTMQAALFVFQKY